MLDGFTIVRELHASSRSHVCSGDRLARSPPLPVVLKTLSTELRADVAQQLGRFLMEDWGGATHQQSPTVLKERPPAVAAAIPLSTVSWVRRW